MASPRVRGQETATTIAINNVPQLQTTDIRSLEMTWELEVQKEGYLGETTDRRDSIYRGVSGKQQYHFENPAIFGIVTSFVGKAQRRTPGVQINTKTTIQFASGLRTRLLIPDISPGGIPLSFSDRAAFGTIDFPYEAADAQLV
jgi:hypothetical protein